MNLPPHQIDGARAYQSAVGKGLTDLPGLIAGDRIEFDKWVTPLIVAKACGQEVSLVGNDPMAVRDRH